MAVASAWAKPGSWALAAEEQDDLPLPPPPPPVPAADFPSLATAAATKVPKKKKALPVSLGEFNSTKFVAPAYRGLSTDELISLPTGPRERTDEELANARGFGARWGGGGGGSRGDDEPRRGGSGPQDFGPSRADEADDWGAGKKPLERRERMGGFGGESRADDVDDWVSAKRAAPPAPMERRERSVAFGGDSHSRTDDSASWVSNKSYSAGPATDSRRGGTIWGFDRDGGPNADSWGRKREEVNGDGSSGGSRPRLNLQKRTLPLANDTDGEGKVEKEEKGEPQQKSNPFGAARPREEVLAAKGENGRKEDHKEEEKLEIQPKTRTLNPFGAARPREEVLAAKAEDQRKIDEKLQTMNVREALPERSDVRGEENGSRQVPGNPVEKAWRKPDAVEEGSEATEETVPAN